MTDSPSRGVTFLEGERVILRPLEADDLPTLQRWMNDPALRALNAETRPTSLAGARAWLERVEADESRVWLVVVLKEDGRVVGETGLLRLFPAWRTTDLTLILGERDTWGTGIAAEVLHLMLDYAFGALGLHRVALGVVGFNGRALRFYEKQGFTREGVQREGYFYDHQFHDFVMLCMLEEEWMKRRG